MCVLCCCFRSREPIEVADEEFPLKNENFKPLQTTPKNIEESIFTALYSFQPTSADEISFDVGDKIHVLEDVVADQTWYKAENLNSNKTGVVPINYLGKKLEKELWWFPDTTYVMAENLLLWKGNDVGSFLVRPSAAPTTPYALSVRTEDYQHNPVVKHYKINYLHGFYFISDNIKTANLQNLITAYLISNSTELGLCENLTNCCAKVNPELYEFGKESISKVEIDHREIILQEPHFASGHFSRIYKAKWHDQTVAVKIPKDTYINREDFIKEVKIMKSLRHKNILTLYGVCSAHDMNYIVLEYMELGSLLGYIKKNTLSHYQRIYVATQIASAMAFLESQKVVHRDLAARNVLLKEKLYVKLGDFGLSRFLSNEIQYTTLASTEVAPRWMAPEFFINGGYTIKADVWSFGILLMEIYRNGETPYSEINNYTGEKLLKQIINGYKMKPVPGLPKNIYKLMELCWCLDPSRRPSFIEIEVFLTKYDLFEGCSLQE